MKIYFIRHGQSEANVQRVISNRGWVHPLTEIGRQQAQTLADRLGSAGIAKIYTSPLRRAVETAEIVAARLAVRIELVDGLREFDCGIAEGRGDPEAWQMHRQAAEMWIARLNWEYRIEGGESFLDMARRFVPLLEGLLQEYRDSDQNLVLIGHGALYYHMLPLVLINVSREKINGRDFPNTAYVLAESSPGGLTCLEWCGMKPGGV